MPTTYNCQGNFFLHFMASSCLMIFVVIFQYDNRLTVSVLVVGGITWNSLSLYHLNYCLLMECGRCQILIKLYIVIQLFIITFHTNELFNNKLVYQPAGYISMMKNEMKMKIVKKINFPINKKLID